MRLLWPRSRIRRRRFASRSSWTCDFQLPFAAISKLLPRCWLKGGVSLMRNALFSWGFLGGIGEPHRVGQRTESQPDFQGKPPRVRARKIASFLPQSPKPLRFRILGFHEKPRISAGSSVFHGRLRGGSLPLTLWRRSACLLQDHRCMARGRLARRAGVESRLTGRQALIAGWASTGSDDRAWHRSPRRCGGSRHHRPKSPNSLSNPAAGADFPWGGHGPCAA